MKILLVRFSSFGDVTQALSVPSALVLRYPGAQVHWVTRADLSPLLHQHPNIHKIWAFDRRAGFRGLWRMIKTLRAEKFEAIYDAHNNLRSRILCAGLRAPWDLSRLLSSPRFLRRSVKRWQRLLLFRFRINLFEQPFSGQRDLLEPLEAWGIPRFPPPPAPQLFLSRADESEAQKLVGEFAPNGYIACAPSAAHFLKRWPVQSWKELILLVPKEKFILLGGPEDTFLQEIAAVAPDRVLNLAGRSGLTVSGAVVRGAKILVTNDTGPLHLAEQLGVPAIALMGPAPFGFPSRPTTKVIEIKLSCRPCSKHGQGPCVNEKYHRCLVDITPPQVDQELRRLIGSDL